MKWMIVSLALAFGSQPVAIDGDTVRVAGVSIRLTDYDAPELFSPKCPREYALAWQAKRELAAVLPTLKLVLVPCAFDNYGRLCARADGLAEHMIVRKFASPYVCSPGYCPHKQNWCS